MEVVVDFVVGVGIMFPTQFADVKYVVKWER